MGLLHLLWDNNAHRFESRIFMVGLVLSVQMSILVQTSFYFYCLIIYCLRKNNQAWQKQIPHGHVQVTPKQHYTVSEGRLAKAIALLISISLFLIAPFFALPCRCMPSQLPTNRCRTTELIRSGTGSNLLVPLNVTGTFLDLKEVAWTVTDG